jgi:hypothetical protein
MQAVLRAFSDELTKIAEVPAEEIDLARAMREARSKGRKEGVYEKLTSGAPTKRNYITSLLIGALATPGVGLASGLVKRVLRNRSLAQLAAKTSGSGAKKAILAQSLSGPIFGRVKPGMKWNTVPLMTPEDLASQAAGGAIMGSLVQALRDRYSGSAPKSSV